MTEKQFIENNSEDWHRIEDLLDNDIKNADEMHFLFLKLSGDLSYAQTYFPRRSIRWYLNSLMSNVFDSMKTKRKFNFLESFTRFYTYNLPSEVIRNKSSFLISFIIFILSFCIGAYSTNHDKQFPRLILGDDYVNMTETNIANKDPMAVYKQGGRLESFLGISINNLKVAFYTFLSGILCGIGTVFIMIYNGIMVGAFQTFFFNKGLLLTSMLTIWIHGTIEILSIIIAGAAGLIVSKHLLFPNTYTRIQSLKIGGFRALIIILSASPLIILAACFEGFVTPQTDLPNWIKILIIFSSFLFMLFIYVFMPYRLYKKGLYIEHEMPLRFNDFEKNNILENEESNFLKKSITFFREHIDKIYKYYVLPVFAIYILFYYFFIPLQFSNEYVALPFAKTITFNNGGLPYLILQTITLMYLFLLMKVLFDSKEIISFKIIVKALYKYFPIFSLAALLFVLPCYFFSSISLESYIIIIIPFSIFTILASSLNDVEPDIIVLYNSIKSGYRHWSKTILVSILLFVIFLLVSTTFSLITYFIEDYISWHNILEDKYHQSIFISNIFEKFVNIHMLIIAYLAFHFSIEKIFNEKYSIDLKAKIEAFTQLKEE